jgi:hypothetical protein
MACGTRGQVRSGSADNPCGFFIGPDAARLIDEEGAQPPDFPAATIRRVTIR